MGGGYKEALGANWTGFYVKACLDERPRVEGKMLRCWRGVKLNDCAKCARKGLNLLLLKRYPYW